LRKPSRLTPSIGSPLEVFEFPVRSDYNEPLFGESTTYLRITTITVSKLDPVKAGTADTVDDKHRQGPIAFHWPRKIGSP
jgi:hypothetical protein